MKGDKIPLDQIGELEVLDVGVGSITLTTPVATEEFPLGGNLTIYGEVTIKLLHIDRSRAAIRIRPGGPAGT